MSIIRLQIEKHFDNRNLQVGNQFDHLEHPWIKLMITVESSCDHDDADDSNFIDGRCSY